jgi:hypothetical protein
MTFHLSTIRKWLAVGYMPGRDAAGARSVAAVSRFPNGCRVLLLLITQLLGSAAVVCADAVPMVTTNTDCYYAINAFDSVDNQLNPTNCTLSGTNASNGSGTVNALAVLAPFTEVEADASETGASVGFGVPNFLAYSSLSYSLKVNGGNLGDRVPLIMTTSASLTGSPSAGSATAYLLVGDGPGLSITDCFGVFNCGTPGITVCNPAGGPGMKCASLAELPKDFNLTVAAGSPIDVLMQATATADTFFGRRLVPKRLLIPFSKSTPVLRTPACTVSNLALELETALRKRRSQALLRLRPSRCLRCSYDGVFEGLRCENVITENSQVSAKQRHPERIIHL